MVWGLNFLNFRYYKSVGFISLGARVRARSDIRVGGAASAVARRSRRATAGVGVTVPSATSCQATLAMSCCAAPTPAAATRQHGSKIAEEGGALAPLGPQSETCASQSPLAQEGARPQPLPWRPPQTEYKIDAGKADEHSLNTGGEASVPRMCVH